MTDALQTSEPQVPDRQRSEVHLRFGQAVDFKASVDVSSTGLLAITALVSGILLSTAVVIFLYSLDCVRLIFNDFGSALFDGFGRDRRNLILIRWIKASVKDSEWGAISILTMPDGRSL